MHISSWGTCSLLCKTVIRVNWAPCCVALGSFQGALYDSTTGQQHNSCPADLLLYSGCIASKMLTVRPDCIGEWAAHAALLAALPDMCAGANAPLLRPDAFVPQLLQQLLDALHLTYNSATNGKPFGSDVWTFPYQVPSCKLQMTLQGSSIGNKHARLRDRQCQR